MSCDWEDNRRSGVALAMRHTLKWFVHLRTQGLNNGDKHLANTPNEAWYSLLYLVHPVTAATLRQNSLLLKAKFHYAS